MRHLKFYDHQWTPQSDVSFFTDLSIYIFKTKTLSRNACIKNVWCECLPSICRLHEYCWLRVFKTPIERRTLHKRQVCNGEFTWKHVCMNRRDCTVQKVKMDDVGTSKQLSKRGHRPFGKQTSSFLGLSRSSFRSFVSCCHTRWSVYHDFKKKMSWLNEIMKNRQVCILRSLFLHFVTDLGQPIWGIKRLAKVTCILNIKYL